MRLQFLMRSGLTVFFLSALFFGLLSVLVFTTILFDYVHYRGSSDDSIKHASKATTTSKATFEKYFPSSSIIALKLNNADNNRPYAVAFACASELFVTSCSNSGFAAMVLMTIDHINLCRKLGAKPTVFWRNCRTVCPKDATINAWEMYFQAINREIEKKAEKVLCLGIYVGVEELLRTKSSLFEANASLIKNRPITENVLNLGFRERNTKAFRGLGVITPDIRKKANVLLQEYFHVTPKIQMMVDRFYSKHLSNHNVLAVHIRGTDHYLEMEELKLRSLRTWIQNTKRLLKRLPSLNKIFIASDNKESVKRFVEEFGDKVSYTKAVRAKKYDGPAVHHSGADPYMIGSQVLVDILLMAKCKHFLHALVMEFGPPSGEELEEECDSAFSCFQQNSRYSVCPDMRKGIFVDLGSLA